MEAIVTQLMEKQRVARAAALAKQLECGCPDSTCADGKACAHPMRRISAAKSGGHGSTSSSSAPDASNQVSSTTGTGSGNSSSGGGATGNSSGATSRAAQRAESISLHGTSGTSSAPPLVLSLSQIQGGGGLLILNRLFIYLILKKKKFNEE